jgi:poly(hydroxyalkanoate) granule-associated protein
MLKKMKAAAEEKTGGEAKDLAQSVLESSRQIWLAGLGAFARAQAEGHKVFETLVRQGEAMESKTRQAAVDTAAAARGAAKAKAKEVQAIAGDTWDRLEQVFEERVARALRKLGVHTQSDVERLAERVDALSEAVNALIRRSGPPRARTKPAAPARAPAAGSARKPKRRSAKVSAKMPGAASTSSSRAR